MRLKHIFTDEDSEVLRKSLSNLCKVGFHVACSLSFILTSPLMMLPALGADNMPSCALKTTTVENVTTISLLNPISRPDERLVWTLFYFTILTISYIYLV